MTHFQFEPRRALRAAKILAADPDDLPQVFTLIESLSGSTLDRVTARLRRSAPGARLLRDRPDIVARLADRAALAELPEGTLGRAYLAFVEREGISADGIRAADAKGMAHPTALPPELAYTNARMRDTHDLWHAAVGYHGDVLGEVALLAFTLAQTGNPAVALMVAIGLTKTVGAPAARRVIYDGFRRGRAAAWLPEQEWESLLALPLDEVRARLSLESSPVYTPVRSHELKARRAAA